MQNGPGQAPKDPKATIDQSSPGGNTGTISADLSCFHCGYNLRGLNKMGRCPECGSSIGLSILGVRRRRRIAPGVAYAIMVATGMALVILTLAVLPRLVPGYQLALHQSGGGAFGTMIRTGHVLALLAGVGLQLVSVALSIRALFIRPAGGDRGALVALVMGSIGLAGFLALILSASVSSGSGEGPLDLLSRQHPSPPAFQ